MLVAVVGAILVFCAQYLPIHVDEAITHRHFVSEGWKVAISTYPFPNNHLLFSFLATIASKLPFSDLLSMRLVSVGSALVSSVLIYKMVGQSSSKYVGALAVLVWLTSLGGFYYSVHARGYGLQTTFVLLSIFSIHKWQSVGKSGGNRNGYLLVFIISSALGFFTVPTYLFPFVSLMAWWFIGSQISMKNLKLRFNYAMIAGAGTTLITLLLYTPLFYYSGIGSLLNNQWVGERSWSNLSQTQWTSFFPDVYAYLGPGIALLLAIYLVVSIVQRSKQQLLLVALIFAPQLLLILFLGTLPFPRTFAYLSAIVTVLAFRGLKDVFENKHIAVSLGLSVLVLFSASKLFTQFKIWEDKSANHSKTIHAHLSDKIGAATIYVNEWDECAQLIDYYSWLDKKGPTVKFVYGEKAWAEIENRKEPTYVFRTGKAIESKNCISILNESGVSVFRCN